MNKSSLCKKIVSFLLFCTSGLSYSLPISFGVNQGSLDYQELITPHFKIYHDKRTPNEAQMTAQTLEAYRKILNTWLGIKRQKPLPIISSAVSSGASFANLITDAIELQTLGQGHRDLFLHEFIHILMYQYYHNWFGPAGSIVHIAWMPVWFLEGLAEALSVSINSDVQAGIERYHALSGNWPSFDRIHSIYVRNRSLMGYATSGSFVSWILKQQKGENLAYLLNDFFTYTLPHYYFLGMNPFSSFMPLDAALAHYSNKNAKALYQEYQKDVTAYWKKNTQGTFLLQDNPKRLRLEDFAYLHSDGQEVFLMSRALPRTTGHQKKMRYKLHFSPTTGWMNSLEKEKFYLPKESSSWLHNYRPKLFLTLEKNVDIKSGISTHSLMQAEVDPENFEILSTKKILSRNAYITELQEEENHITWIEQEQEISRLCFLDKKDLNKNLQDKHAADDEQASEIKFHCPIEERLPRTIEPLGATYEEKTLSSGQRLRLSKEIWYTVQEQTLLGDRFELAAWDSNSHLLRKIPYQGLAKPLRLTQIKEELWLLLAERKYRTLQKLDSQGKCLGTFAVDDHILDMVGLDSGHLILSIYDGLKRSYLKVKTSWIPLKPCYTSQGHSSPLLWAMQAGPTPPDLQTALQKASIHSDIAAENKEQEKEQAKKIKAALSLEKKDPSRKELQSYPNESSDVHWRSRHIVSVPVLGVDVKNGTQIGFISLPLMDDMQNESLNLQFLYSPKTYPATYLTFASTRFWPTLSLSAYRYQKWDGHWQDPENPKIRTASYADEKGILSFASWPLYWQNKTLTLGLGAKIASRQPSIGPHPIIQGTLVEPMISSSFQTNFGRYTWGLSAQYKRAPASLNKKFDYQKTAFATSLRAWLPYLDSNLNLGLSFRQTKAKEGKAPKLKEIYQAIDSTLPGNPKISNQLFWPVYGLGSLFQVHFGDSVWQANTKWTVPLIEELDYQWWIFYLDRCNFQAIYNTGTAWYSEVNPQGWQDTISSQSYHLTLYLANKGINFHTSLGLGQVIGEGNWLSVLGFGFEALF